MGERMDAAVRSRLLLVAIVLVCAGTTPAQLVRPSDSAPGTPDAVAPANQAASPSEDLVALVMQNLNLRQKISQLMFVTFKGLYGPDNDDRALLTNYMPGGVIIPLAVKPRNAAEYVAALRGLGVERSAGIPLFIGANLYRLGQHEDRLLSTFAQLPTPMALAATQDASLAAKLGDLVADHLVLMGFNLVVGPNLELASTMPEAVGSLERFGSEPDFAANVARALVAAETAKGLLVMPVGFPGGGANRTPGKPAVLLTPRSLLKDTDLLPFKAAMEAGAPLIHVGNTLAPMLDASSAPASLSSVVMKDVLRSELGYDGLAVAGPVDCSDMERLYPSHQAALLALEAGADMVLWDRAGAHVAKGVETIALAVEQGRLPVSVIDTALRRVLDVKKQHDLLNRPAPDPAKAEGLEKKKQYAETAYEIERQSITLVQNKGGIVPLAEDAALLPVGITGVVGVESLFDILRKELKAVVQQPIATASHVGAIEDFEIFRLTSRLEGLKTAVCLLTEMRKHGGQVDLIRQLHAKGVRVIVVMLGYPGNLPRLVEADAILCAYCEPRNCEQSIRAVADALLGRAPARILDVSREMEVTAGKEAVFDISNVVWSPPGRLPMALGEVFRAGAAAPSRPDRVVKKAEWDFGNGVRAKELYPKHTYPAAGEYTLTLKVTCNGGDTAQGAFTIKAAAQEGMPINE